MPTEIPVLQAVYQRRLYANATSPLHLVALVTTTEAETAFDLTNHGGRQDTWMNNPGVVPLDLGGRSSGVHDVFVGDQEALLYLGAGTTTLALPTRAVNVTVLLALPSRLVWADARVCLLGETTDEDLRAELSRPEVARRLLAELEGEPDLPGTPRVSVQGALTQAAEQLGGLRSQSGLRARVDALPDHQARVDVMAAALAISGVAAGAETLALARAVVDARDLTSFREAQRPPRGWRRGAASTWTVSRPSLGASLTIQRPAPGSKSSRAQSRPCTARWPAPRPGSTRWANLETRTRRRTRGPSCACWKRNWASGEGAPEGGAAGARPPGRGPTRER